MNSEPSERTAAELKELQQQSANIDRLKELIQNTLQEHREELKLGPSELLRKYPHYKNADMVRFTAVQVKYKHNKNDGFIRNIWKMFNECIFFQLLYEFSLLVNTDLVILRQKASILMESLYAVDEQLFPASTESNLTTIKSIQRMLTPNRLKKKKNLKLAIECKDVS